MKFYKRGISLILTISIISILLILGPAEAVKINISSPNNAFTGDDISFKIKVDIENIDSFVPIKYTDIKFTDPNNSTETCRVFSNNIVTNCSLNLTVLTTIKQSSFGYGYGYGYDNNFGYNFGYGYGYNNLNGNEIEYEVTWHTDINTVDGEYTVKAFTLAESPKLTHIFESKEKKFKIKELTLKEKKNRILDKVKKLPKDNKKDKNIDKAVEHLLKSLNINPKDQNETWKKFELWLDDNNLDMKNGHIVYNEDKKAVKDLEKVCEIKDCKGVGFISFENDGNNILNVKVFYENKIIDTILLGPDKEFSINASNLKNKIFKKNKLVISVDNVFYDIDTSCSEELDELDMGDLTITDYIEEIEYKEKICSQEKFEKINNINIDISLIDKQFALDNIDKAESQITNCNEKDKKKIMKKIEKAKEKLEKGDLKLSQNKIDKAIKEYRKSWKHSNKALKEISKKC